ncbi:type III pantothenate kinase [Butyrivibrio sp. MC2021]|uniref:type III pantothenate kinase n=1 Tax=Butyrivibrio sp. MC2021 TaxID=1408306 RepID=UPI000685336D|nr:type III pantothenate kinase [Butyrivibrio sp. MC2021]
MILTFDTGNTNVAVCGVLDGKILFKKAFETKLFTAGEGYLPALKDIFEKNNITAENISGTIISSVVPDADNRLKEDVYALTGKYPLMAKASMKTGVPVKGYDEKGLGIDRLVDCVAASRYYGNPVIVYDLGSATTMSVVDREGFFVGGSISAGVQLSLDVLGEKCARLPALIARDHQGEVKEVIGKDTVSCMTGGAIIAAAAMIDGMSLRASGELGYPDSEVRLVLTGGNAALVYPHLLYKNVIYDPDLLHKGLALIYDLNRE